MPPRGATLAGRLATLGFADTVTAQRLLTEELALDLAGADATLVSELAAAPDPDLALGALARLGRDEVLGALRSDPDLRSRLLAVLGASPALGEHLRRHPGDWRLLAEHDAELPRCGIGFTDVVKRPSANAGDLNASDFEKWVPCLLQKFQRYAPRVACFHGLTAYRPFLKRALRCTDPAPMLGQQPGFVGATRLYVVPNPSPANAHFTLADQTAWYDRLADFLATVMFSD